MTNKELSSSELLFKAVRNNNIDTIDFLLEYGANPDYQEESSQMTSLMFASYAGNIIVVEALLDYNADVNLQNSKKETALDYAIKWGHFKTATILLENRALVKIDSQTKDGKYLISRNQTNNDINAISPIPLPIPDKGIYMDYHDGCLYRYNLSSCSSFSSITDQEIIDLFMDYALKDFYTSGLEENGKRNITFNVIGLLNDNAKIIDLNASISHDPIEEKSNQITLKVDNRRITLNLSLEFKK